MQLRTLSGRRLAPLALAAHPETPADCLGVARDAGINTFFFYDMQAVALVDALAAALASCRDDVALLAGTEGRSVAGLHADLDAICSRLGVDVLDAFLLFYVAPIDDTTVVGRLLDELVALREEGRIRHVGVSAHNRDLARAFAADARVDVLMHRYNMAHRGAEATVLPAALVHDTPVIAFTCTRWGTLLAGHPDWTGPPPTAADCYRFALAQPAVQLALTAPSTVTQLRENLAALDAPALTPDEVGRWRAYGDLVYGGQPGEFETSWP